MAVAEPNPGPLPHLCLKWNNYQSNLANVFDQLLQSETFVDVTLAAEGQSIKAHKLVLSACSPYFQILFNENPCPHPIIILKDTKYDDLKAVVEYMYKGEISVAQNELNSLLKVADSLRIRGLSEMETSSPTPPSPNAKKPESPHSTSAKEDQASPRPTKRRRSSGDQPSSDVPSSPSNEGISAVEVPTSSFGAVTVTPVLSSNQKEEAVLKPGIEDLIREEERAKMMDVPSPHMFPNSAASPNPNMLSAMDAYNMQLQAVLWQRAWAMHQTPQGGSPLMPPGPQGIRFRERGPFKTWRPETMAEAIVAVLREGLSLSQAARKYDIPYPTFVLYANRVNNMLGPPDNGQSELRTKGRGRPQRILTGQWSEDHIQGVIRAVVFRDPSAMKDIKLESDNAFPGIVPPGQEYSKPSEMMPHSHLPQNPESDMRRQEGVPKHFEDSTPPSARSSENLYRESPISGTNPELMEQIMPPISGPIQHINGIESIPGPSNCNAPQERQACMYSGRDEDPRMTAMSLLGNAPPQDLTGSVVSNEPVEEIESTFDPAYLVGIRVKQEHDLYDMWK
ncbi:protein bric-a-brac 1-like isoform X2 [Artemia franciscana]|uniref:protein bric-a-brac 1-like isoform X2 n=1 Tax=Artemia franciscana TaxID=6661 RepID=UPI0032D9E575